MDRRSFLKILGAAGVAIVAAPQAVVARALKPTTVLPPAIDTAATGLQTISITFPDGTTWQMQGIVTSQMVNAPIDGTSETTITFQPTGPCECIEEGNPWRNDVNVTVNGSPIGSVPVPKTPKRCPRHPRYKAIRPPKNCFTCQHIYEAKHAALRTNATTIELDGVSVGEIQDIVLPQMQRQMIDVTRDPAFTGLPDAHREFVPGLKRSTPMTFTINFDGRVYL